MKRLFVEGLLLLGHVAVSIQVPVMFEVLFQEITGVLIREQRIHLNCQLLPVQILIRDVICHIRGSAGTNAEAHAHCEQKAEYGNHFFHLI